MAEGDCSSGLVRSGWTQALHAGGAGLAEANPTRWLCKTTGEGARRLRVRVGTKTFFP